MVLKGKNKGEVLSSFGRRPDFLDADVARGTMKRSVEYWDQGLTMCCFAETSDLSVEGKTSSTLLYTMSLEEPWVLKGLNLSRLSELL